MKYFGKRSLSSFLSIFLRVGWYVVLVFSIIMGIVGYYFFFAPNNDPMLTQIAHFMNWNIQNKDWVIFKNLSIFIRILFIPYYIVLVILILKLIKKGRDLFTNFKNEILFNKANVNIITSISKLLIPFSILTFNFSSLIVSLLLFMLCEIFKKGSLLQEEHDLTI